MALQRATPDGPLLKAGALYFAYGSNLDRARLAERVPSAQPAGIGRWPGWRLVIDKPGRDGSAKANVVPAAAGAVWGALYTLDPDEWSLLDRFEGGYERVHCRVLLPGEGAAGRTQEAQSYVSASRAAMAPMQAWYRAHMAQGAQAHGLPPAWCEMLAALPATPGDGDAAIPSDPPTGGQQ